jgi:putative membrane protein
MQLTAEDHARVTAAVAAAEAQTSGEIVTIVAQRSDSYHDVALHWAVMAMLAALAVLATWPRIAEAVHYTLAGEWAEPAGPRALLTIATLVAAATFLLARVLLSSMTVRLWLTPGTTEARRVRRAALAHFRSSVEHRTAAHSAVLVYLSLAEHRAEIVADAGIHGRVAPALWGEAMAEMLAEVGEGRPAEGLAAAVTRIGAVLAEHFPRGAEDVNELPDQLVEL